MIDTLTNKRKKRKEEGKSGKAWVRKKERKKELGIRNRRKTCEEMKLKLRGKQKQTNKQTNIQHCAEVLAPQFIVQKLL